MAAKSVDPPFVKPPEPPQWSAPTPLRTAVSLLLATHLIVVIAVPLAMIPPASPLASSIARWAAPYVEAGNVSHGYAFFAPDPGQWSHLVRYRIEFDDERPPLEGTMPSLDEQWPRLLYHRHFMLTEQLALRVPPEDLPPEVQEEALRRTLLPLAQSYADHLRRKHGASRVTLDLVRHVVPPIEDITAGRKLADDAYYQTYPRSPLVESKEQGGAR